MARTSIHSVAELSPGQVLALTATPLLSPALATWSCDGAPSQSDFLSTHRRSHQAILLASVTQFVEYRERRSKLSARSTYQMARNTALRMMPRMALFRE